MKKIELPKIKLTEPERKWLELLYDKVKNSEKIGYRELRSQLYKEIPKDFHPKQMSRLLIDHSGERITLLGIYSINPETKLIDKTNSIINYIRETLIADPRIKEINASKISEQLKISEPQVGLILYLLSRYGWFIKAATISQTYFGYSSIDLGDGDEGFDQFIYFNSIEELIQNEYLKELDSQDNTNLKENRINESDTGNEEQRVSVFKPIFHSKIPQTDKKLCFVLMPFGMEWSDRVYRSLLRENIESLGLQCLRADNLKGTIIMEDIWTKINQAAFIIADVTERNPNVMYEMGIVHSIGKPAILITQDINNIPFDFKHLRHQEYRDNSDSFKTFGIQLKEIVVDLYKNHYQDIVLIKS